VSIISISSSPISTTASSSTARCSSRSATCGQARSWASAASASSIWADQGSCRVSLRQAQTPGRYDRYRIGIHHIAFQAPSREIVDERLRWARGQGLEIENDPKEYDYRPGYYAGFLYDPDGIKLEIVHVP
jgi:catechol 2,3-dioxygenase-like lactoylglutathione lyase family enzyme